MPGAAYGLLAFFTSASVILGWFAARLVGPRRALAALPPMFAAFAALFLVGHRSGLAVGPSVALFGFEVRLAFDLAVAAAAAFVTAHRLPGFGPVALGLSEFGVVFARAAHYARSVRTDDFWVDENGGQQLDIPLLRDLRRAPSKKYSDLQAAIALGRLLHEQFQRYGTDSTQEITDSESREAMRTLVALTGRLGVTFKPPFRDLPGFRAYWGSHGGYGSWAARRGMLQELFDPLHEELERLEEDVLRGELAEPISRGQATGWPAVDLEIAELRRHFHNALTPQDYRNIGNDVVAVLEALSAAAYDPARHPFEGETESPVTQTKNRIARVIEVDSEREGSDELVRLARATVDMAQAVKHNAAGSRVRAGIAADAVIQLANMVRRLQDSEPPE